MKVTQEIYVEFDPDQFEELREKAREEGLQIDELIVRAIKNILRKEGQ